MARLEVAGLSADVSQRMEAQWPASTAEAHRRLDAFIADRVASYQKDRDFPALNGTSTLSPYLAAGLVSARQCLDAALGANQGEFGLGGSVWCKDEARAMEIAQQLQTGTVWVNEIHTFSPLKPMAGHKQSGVGVENGTEGLLEYTLPRVISLKRAA